MTTLRASGRAPLVVHLVFRFDTGGLENGVVNLINHMPQGAFRHAVVALTDVAPAFAERVRRSDVEFIALHKPPGHAARLYPRLASLMRSLQPAIVHTRNLAALECQVPAAWVGVPVRVHGEHGRDADDPDGTRSRYRWLRRAYSPFVHRYVALSRDLERYLVDGVGISGRRVAQIYNGVDTVRFQPAPGGPLALAGCPFDPAQHFIVGTVGRMQTVKAQPDLARAFVRALALQPALRTRLRLVMVGDGALRSEVQAVLEAAGCLDLAWLPGERSDIPQVMRGLHAFALPSHAEGVSNTVLEAMASGLPVLATRVGGNPELLVEGATGALVEAAQVDTMAEVLRAWACDPIRTQAMGVAGRSRVEQSFSLPVMVQAYTDLYDSLLRQAGNQN